MRVLFVCLGNICRSPLAEGLFLHQLTLNGRPHRYEVDSCGTGNYHIGALPDLRTRRNAESNGVVLTHRCRQIIPEDLERFDLILPMDGNNLKNILALPNAEQHRHKITLIRTFDPKAEHSDVPDPYHGTEEDFQEVFEILNRSIAGLIRHLEGQA